jgi:hypothetical protein
MALSTAGTLLLAVNNAEDPPFATLFAANGDNAFEFSCQNQRANRGGRRNPSSWIWIVDRAAVMDEEGSVGRGEQ